MFADMTGSTMLGAQLEPEDFRDLLHAWRDCVTGLVVRYGGRVTTHVGDGILAFFGYPQANEVDAERAVRSGLAIIEAVGHLHTGAGPPGTLRARVGLATGPVIVGDLIGAGSSLEWSVVSETTNLAARLQTLAQPGMVVIDDLTHHLSGGMFEYAALGPAQLKGTASSVQPWAVLRESMVESRFEALRTVQLPLIGREDEAALLQRRWAKARTGIGHAVVLVGEAGLGKSRLIAAFEEQIGTSSNSMLRLSCSPHYPDTPLYPLIRYFEAAAGFLRIDSPAQKFVKLQRLLQDTSGLEEERTAVLADLLSITAPPDVLMDRATQRTNELTFNAVLRHLEALALKAPLLAIVEDFHWADPSTNALLDALVNEVEHIPALLIISTRPERRLPWSLYPQVTTQVLNGLDRRQAALLVRQIAGERLLADDVIARVIERAQGVPLFLEELTRSILGSGRADTDGDRDRRVLPMSGGTVPTSLNALLMARLDQLGAGKEVAQASSVIGREFSFEMLQAVSALPTEQLKQALAELTQAGLIVPRGPPVNASYVFYHALIQEAAYESMLRDRRRAVHLRYAQALEKDPAGPVSTAPELLAAHFAEAGAAEKSIEYYLSAAARATGRLDLCTPEALAACFLEPDLAEKMVNDYLKVNNPIDRFALAEPEVLAAHFIAANAGQKTVDNYLKANQTASRFALAEIVGYLQKAVWQIASLPTTVETQRRELALRLALGRALLEHRGLHDDQVCTTFERAYELCLILGGTEQLPQIHDALANYYFFHSELDKVAQCGERAIKLGRQMGNQHAVVLAHRTRGYARLLLGDFRGARDDLEQAIAKYDGEMAIARDPKVSACVALGICLTALGLPDSGAAMSVAGIRHAETLSHPISLNSGLRRACVEAMLRRDVRRVLQLSSRLLDNQSDYDSVRGSLDGLFCATWAELQMNPEPALLERLCTTIDFFEKAGYLNLLAFYVLCAAELTASLGDLESANRLICRATKLVETTHEHWCEAEIPRLRARLTSDSATSTHLLEASLSLAREQGALLWEVRAATDLAKLLQRHGKYKAAHGALAPVVARINEGLGIPDFSSAEELLQDLNSATD